jgi:hypothetical protein
MLDLSNQLERNNPALEEVLPEPSDLQQSLAASVPNFQGREAIEALIHAILKDLQLEK